MKKNNLYKSLKEKNQEEFNKFPIKFAFDDEQFKKCMKELGLTENDIGKVVGIGYGGFIRKSDVKAFNEMNRRHRKEEKQAIDNDLTGEGYIKDMFEYELENHEYGYTHELEETLETLGLTIEEINNNEKLRHGLEIALNRYNEVEEEEEYEE